MAWIDGMGFWGHTRKVRIISFRSCVRQFPEGSKRYFGFRAEGTEIGAVLGQLELQDLGGSSTDVSSEQSLSLLCRQVDL